MAWLIVEMWDVDILGRIDLGIGGGSVRRRKGESSKENRRDMLSPTDPR